MTFVLWIIRFHLQILRYRSSRVKGARWSAGHAYYNYYKILKLSDIYLSQIGKFMFSFKKGLLPDAFNEMFLLTNQIHHYNTRNSNSFYLFSWKTNIWQLAIRFQGPNLFNSFNTEIQNADSFSQFKSKLKTFRTDFPLFCLFVCVLAFYPKCVYKLNLTRLKLSFYICIFLVVSVAWISVVSVAWISPNGFYLGILALCFSLIWLFNISCV